jgi:peptide subunit release factor RF-3
LDISCCSEGNIAHGSNTNWAITNIKHRSGLFDLANDDKAESGSNEPVNVTNKKETTAMDPPANDTEEVKMTDDSQQVEENNTEVVVSSSEESGDGTASHGKGSPVDVGIAVAVIVITVLLFAGIIWKRRSR